MEGKKLRKSHNEIITINVDLKNYYCPVLYTEPRAPLYL